MKKLLSIVSVVGFAGLMLAGVGQIALACGACVVGWDSNHPPYTTCQVCTLAGSLEVFSYDLNTRGSSAGKGDADGNWELWQAINGSNISSASITHETNTIHEVGGIAEFAITTHCQGVLTQSTGYADLSAYDATGCLDCAGSHRVQLKAHTGSCP